MNLYKYINFAEETQKKNKDSKKKSFLKKHWKKLALGAGALALGGLGTATYLNRDKIDKYLTNKVKGTKYEGNYGYFKENASHPLRYIKSRLGIGKKNWEKKNPSPPHEPPKPKDIYKDNYDPNTGKRKYKTEEDNQRDLLERYKKSDPDVRILPDYERGPGTVIPENIPLEKGKIVYA